MKTNKIIFLTLAFFTIILNIHAQNPTQIRILNNYDLIPFEDGKTVIAEISFTGFKHESDIEKVLKDYRNNITVGEFFKGSKVSQAVKTIRKYLVDEGYDKVEITALGEMLPTDQMKLIFSAKQGEQARVSEIRFEGNANVSNSELITNAKKCIGDGWEIYSKRKYEYIANKCARDLMGSKGYLKAEIKNIIYQPDENKNVVLIEVNEGIRYQIGKIEIEGLSVFSKEQFLKMLGQKTGEIANAKKLRKSLYEEVNIAYKNIGYLQYDAELDPELINSKIEGQDGIFNLKIVIDEGRQFRLHKIEVVGVNLKEARRIRNLLAISDGGIYEVSKVKNWVDELNKSGKYGFIDFDKDSEIRTDGETDRVYLVLKVNPK
jgi:outer membrane protein assembly factor BamA